MVIILLIADLERVDMSVAVFAVIARCKNGGKSRHLLRSRQVIFPIYRAYDRSFPRRGALNSKIDMDLGLVHQLDSRIDLAPVIHARRFFNVCPVNLVAYPANIQLLVECDKLGVCVDGGEAIRTVRGTWPMISTARATLACSYRC